MKQREYVLYAKKIKICLICIIVALFWRISTGHKLRTLFCVGCTTQIRFLHLFMLWFEWKWRILVVRLTQNSVRSLHPVDTLQNGATPRRRRIVEYICNFYWQSQFCQSILSDFSGPWQLFTWWSMGQSQASRFSSKYLKLSSEDEQSFYGFRTTWG